MNEIDDLEEQLAEFEAELALVRQRNRELEAELVKERARLRTIRNASLDLCRFVGSLVGVNHVPDGLPVGTVPHVNARGRCTVGSLRKLCAAIDVARKGAEVEG